MARDKTLRSTRTRRPVRLQDSHGLSESILQDVEVEITNAIDARVTVLEGIVIVGSTIHTADVDLPQLTGGQFTIEGTFTESQVGAPVLIAQGANPLAFDDAEFAIVQFVGQVLDSRRLRVAWSSGKIPPRRVRIHYIIGTTRGVTTWH